MYLYDITVTHCVVNRYNLCKTITARHTLHVFCLISYFLARKDNSFEQDCTVILLLRYKIEITIKIA